MKYMSYIFSLFLLILGCAVSNLYAMEKGIFQPPSLEGYTLVSTKQLDKDEVEDGVKETTSEIYKNSAGQIIGRYITKDHTWVWAVKKTQDLNDTTQNYVIRDSTGNGTYDEKYSLTEDFFLPSYLK
ncbi:MAG: hypothetical protein FJ139_06540 [Deltaproteobacteria bacterium]|nr:hypothetical protein [Deltaproteobacteria bacterium]